MNDTALPRRHNVRPCQPDVVDQTTARLTALNETLRELRGDVNEYDRNPWTHPDWPCRKKAIIACYEARAEVYEEIARLVGPGVTVDVNAAAAAAAAARASLIAQSEIARAEFDHAQERRGSEPREETVGGAHSGL